ncbi:MAG: transporter substrate-binding domain-containing protein [Burkholderiales bacterium]
MMLPRPLVACVVALLLPFLAACATTGPGPAATPEARQALAPTGSLRVGVYRGSPTSYVVEGNAAPRGVGYDLGRALAQALGVPFVPVVFEKNADVFAGLAAGKVDVTFTNATPARARDLDFTPPFLDVEQGYLVPPRSPVESQDGIDRPGMRVGVSVGSTSEATLGRVYRHATLVRVPTLENAVEWLRDGRLDAFATNKAILYELSDALPGSRVLPGHWGLEHFAAGIPKGREAGMPFARAFVAQAIADGTVAAAVARAGVRGTVAPQ